MKILGSENWYTDPFGVRKMLVSRAMFLAKRSMLNGGGRMKNGCSTGLNRKSGLVLKSIREDVNFGARYNSSGSLGSYEMSTPLADEMLKFGYGRIVAGHEDSGVRWKKEKTKAIKQLEQSRAESFFQQDKVMYNELIESIDAMDSSMTSFDPKKVMEVPSNLDSALETHGVTQLVSKYIDLSNVIPEQRFDVRMPVNSSFEMDHMIHEMTHIENVFTEYRDKTIEQAAETSLLIERLLYLKAEDLLRMYPEVDRIMEQEIRDSRWDLVAGPDSDE